jgi:hypothetical protein
MSTTWIHPIDYVRRRRFTGTPRTRSVVRYTRAI